MDDEDDARLGDAGQYVKPAKGSVPPKIPHGVPPVSHTLHLHDDENG